MAREQQVQQQTFTPHDDEFFSWIFIPVPQSDLTNLTSGIQPVWSHQESWTYSDIAQGNQSDGLLS
jgi:hypothetical protein